MSSEFLKKYGINGHRVVRSLQIFIDSLRISLKSKNFDTALYRNQLMNEKLSRLASCGLPKHYLEQVKKVADSANEEFKTALYLNAAKGFMSKSLKMKSPKGKIKYLNSAKDILETGMKSSGSDEEKIKLALSEVDREIKLLSEGKNT